MNQNNNFNSNSSNNNSRPVKNRFFNLNMLDDNLDDVASSTSDYVSNQYNNPGFNNNSNMVSSDSFNNNNANSNEILNEGNLRITSIFSQDLLKDVNSVVYTDSQPEVLDNNNNNDSNLFGYTNTEVLDNVVEREVLDMPQTYNNLSNVNNPNTNSVNNNINNILVSNDNINDMNNANESLNYNNMNQGAVAPIFNQDNSVNENNVVNEISGDLIAQQPLSMNSLGAAPAEMNGGAEVVDENSRFFKNESPVVQNNITQNEVVVTPVAPIASMFDDEVVKIDETALIKAYVGKSYQKIYMSNFNFPAMIFGSLVFFYRKLYLIGIIIFVLQCAILYMFKDLPYIILAVLFVVGLIMGLVINPLYLYKAKIKAKKVIKHFPKVSQGELNHLIAKRGRKNILLALILQILLCLGAGYLAVSLLGKDYFIDLYNDAKSFIISKTEKPVVYVYDGEINYSSVDINKYIDVSLSDKFVSRSDSLFNYSYVTDGVGEDNSCDLTIGFISDFKNPSDMINKMADYYEVEDVSVSDFGELKWHILIKNDITGVTYYRASKIDKRVIMIEYKSGINTPDGVCDTEFVNILDSIQLK